MDKAAFQDHLRNHFLTAFCAAASKSSSMYSGENTKFLWWTDSSNREKKRQYITSALSGSSTNTRGKQIFVLSHDYIKMGEVIKSQEYQSFRGSVPQKKFIVDEDNTKVWTLYDAGPRSVKCPLFCFPPASGTADVFFRQVIFLSSLGYRVIAAEYPVYWNMREFCEGFRKLLDMLQLDKVHIFGASLGGFLAQKFAEYTSKSPRVASLILCNSFYDTSIFQQTNSAPTFWMMPALFLKKMVMGSFEKGLVDSNIADSVDFLVDKLDGLSQQELASRLTLNCMSCYIEPQKLDSLDITLLDVFDDCALSEGVREEMYKCYPNAKRAHMKDGGNFPYLSRSDDVNIFLRIHLMKFEETKFTPREKTSDNNQQSIGPSEEEV
ncbi:hypothetical protein ScPMuIL_018048 [Solemya velum]